MRHVTIIIAALMCCMFIYSVIHAALPPVVSNLAPYQSSPVTLSISDQTLTVVNAVPPRITVMDQYGRVVSEQRVRANYVLGDITVFADRIEIGGVALRAPFTGSIYMAADVGNDGMIYVTDAKLGKVHVFSRTAYVRSFGTKGTALSQLTVPTGIRVERVSGMVHIVDQAAGRIKVWSPAGVYQSVYAAFGSGPGKLTKPAGIDFQYVSGALSRIYVVDLFQSNVQVFDGQTKAFLAFIGSYGASLSKGQMSTPSSVVFDEVNSRLLVASDGGIAVFGIDGGTSPVPPPPVQPVQNAIVLESRADTPFITSLPIQVFTTPIIHALPDQAVTNEEAVSIKVQSESIPLLNGKEMNRDGVYWSGAVLAGEKFTITTGSFSETRTVLSGKGVLTCDISDFQRTDKPTIVVSGTADTTDVSVNDKVVQVDGGTWSTEISLNPGINNIYVTNSKLIINKTVIFSTSVNPMKVESPLGDTVVTEPFIDIQIDGQVTRYPLVEGWNHIIIKKEWNEVLSRNIYYRKPL